MQHSSLSQGFGFPSYAGENNFLESMLPAVFDILQVGRMRERDRSTRIELSFHCLLGYVVGILTYDIKNKGNPAYLYRFCTDASFMVDEPVKRTKERERFHP
jgi:hypothetical protein